MKRRILTLLERRIISVYLETGDKLEGFRSLLHRIRHMQQVKEDLDLIRQFLQKVEETK